MARGSWVVVAVVVAWSARARADDESPLAGYPTELADRPLLLPGGVTSTGASLSFPTDSAAGEHLFDFARLGLGVSHSFGGVEPYIGMAVLIDQPSGAMAPGLQWVDAGAMIATGEHGALDLSAYWHFPGQSYTDYEVQANYDLKVNLVPHTFSVYGGVGVWFERFGNFPTLGADGLPAIGNGAQLGGYANVEGELQLTSRLAFGLTLTGHAPIAHWEDVGPVPWSTDVGSWLLYCFGNVDLEAGVTIADVSGGADPELGANVDLRF